MRRLIGILGVVAACGSKPAARPAEPRPAQVEPSDDLRLCCEQCSAAASSDPAGMDIRGKACTEYRGQPPGVDDACAALFQEHGTLVGDCLLFTEK